MPEGAAIVTRLTPAYKKYIESPRWAAKVELYYIRFGKFCKACGTTKNLHVHHLSYEQFGNEPLTDLISLCHEHHRGVHAMHRTLRRKDMRTATLLYVRQIRKDRVRRTA